MKKFVVLSLISFLILAFGATVYGQEKAPVLEFKASGFVDTQTLWYRNVATSASADGIAGPPAAAFLPYGKQSSGAAPSIAFTKTPLATDILFAPPAPDGVWAVYRPAGSDKYGEGAQFNKKNAYLETRARLKFDAIMGKNLSGTIYFEMDSSRWGELSPSGAQRNAMGTTSTSADRAAVEVKNAYLDFGVPVIPVPVTMRVGLQPLGVRPDMVLSTDGMGVTVGIRPIDPLTIGVIWGKWYEGKDANSDDIDAYALTLAYKMQTITLGGYGLYFNMNEYPIPSAIPAYGATSKKNADFYWLGAYLDGKMGPVNAKVDFVLDSGTVEDRSQGIRNPDVDYSGWAARVYVDYPWEKFNFGFKGLYATGSDLEKTKDVGSYVIPPSSEEFGAFGEGIVFYGTWINRGDLAYFTPGYSNVGRGAFGGTWMAKLYAAFKVTPEWKTTIEAMYIGDTTKHGNTVGNATKLTGLPRDDGDIGIEVDWINELNIYKNLKWDVGLGWLFAGDALEYKTDTAGYNKSPKDPWMVTTRLTYTF